MRGDDSARYCDQCQRTIVNLSALSEKERVALLSGSRSGDLCVAYYKRLSGEYVTPEAPLKESEMGKFQQYRYAVLSAGALAVALGCAPATPSPTEKKDSARAKADQPEPPVVVIMGLPAVVSPPEKPQEEKKKPNQASEPTAPSGRGSP